MCWQYSTRLTAASLTRLSPAVGPTTRARTITLSGTGFLPISGADMVQFGSRLLAARCSSATRCTVKVPARTSGTVAVRLITEDGLTDSRVRSADHYRFVPAPAVTSLSPRRGSASGGTTITIRGGNLIGVTAVDFGARHGTKIRVLSSTEIKVRAPPGSGTVSVTVVAAGGTSRIVSASHYRF